MQEWKEKLATVQKEQVQKIERLKMVLEEIKLKIEAARSRSKYFKLTKMPQMTDVNCNGKINFEWPTDSIMKEMLEEEEISVEAITIR